MAVDAELLPELVEGANNVREKNCTSIRDRHVDKSTSSYHAHLVQVVDSVFHLLLHLVFQLVEVCTELLPPADPFSARDKRSSAFLIAPDSSLT